MVAKDGTRDVKTISKAIKRTTTKTQTTFTVYIKFETYDKLAVISLSHKLQFVVEIRQTIVIHELLY